MRHLPISTLLITDAEAWERLIANREFLTKVLEKHAEDNLDSATCIQITWEDPDFSVERIAAERARSERTIYRLLGHDNKEIARIAREMAGKELPVDASRTPAA